MRIRGTVCAADTLPHLYKTVKAPAKLDLSKFEQKKVRIMLLPLLSFSNFFVKHFQCVGLPFCDQTFLITARLVTKWKYRAQ